MSRLLIAPTKSNQLGLRRDLGLATEGFALLDQKREILVMEVVRLLERVRQAQVRLKAAETRAFEVLRKALAHDGRHHLQQLAGGVRYEHRIQVGTRVAAGVRLPTFALTLAELQPRFGLAGAGLLTDETMQAFLELLAAVGEMAQLETAVWQVARELKRTQRRVNALEQIFVPDFKDTLKFIGDALESQDLGAFAVRKMIKRRLART